MVSRARIFLNGLSLVHFRFESSTCCICCCCFWSAPRRDCLKSAITMCLVRFSVCQLIGYWCCYCYLPIQRKKSVFFLLKIILVWSVWAEKYFSHWQISSWSGQFLKWILLYILSIILLTLYALESSIYSHPLVNVIFYNVISYNVKIFSVSKRLL